MKKTPLVLALAILFVGCVLFAVQACEKENCNQFEAPHQAVNAPISTTSNLPLDTTPGLPNLNYSDPKAQEVSSLPTTTCISEPLANNYLSSPSGSATYSNITYYGGPFQSCVSSINGTTITIRMNRTDGYMFPVNSILSIKDGTAGGPVVVSTTAQSSSLSTYYLNFNAVAWNNSGGNVKNYVMTWKNPASGLTFYTQSIRIISLPTGWGVSLGNLNGVPVYSNGWGGFSGTYYTDTWGIKYQCVHFIRRYYSAYKNKNIGSGDAGVYWTNYQSYGLTQRVYNNSNGVPQHGDIICFSTSGHDHVGIVDGIVSGYLRVFEENVGQTLNSSGNYCSAYKDFSYSINSSGGYNIVASSGLGTGWVTQGWVR